ncbi:hypothetical protein MLD38_026369 [Melastoma candidum]|uniref:Uncharacterized protein n=1 Tax=Melastoma candidum TaxID=119954 RepID=A0ACB9P4Z6_9MYRT|nr:hypothetical protein MLD38_026369 [Melastoma candidum]
MASRSFAKATLVLSSLSGTISRRGYAAQGAVSSANKTRAGITMKRQAEDAMGSAAQEKSAWGPDPKTGYYRPENRREEIDVAELRAALLRHGN